MQKRKSRAYYQYMLDVTDQKVGYYSTDDISLIVYDLLDDGDEEEALAACQKGLDQHPDDEYVLIIKAKVLARMRRYDESLRLLQGNPDEHSPFGLSIRFAIDIHREGDRKALDQLLAALTEQKLTVQETIDIIDEGFDDLQRDVAAEFLLKVFDHMLQTKCTPSGNEQPAENLGRIGALLMDCGRHREAIPVLEKALDIDAYDVYSWQDLSRCQFELRMHDECQQTCEMGLAIDPDNPLFNFALGAILSENQHYAEAVELLEKVRLYNEGKLQHEDLHLDRQEMEQQHNLTYDMLGGAYQALGQTDKAITNYTALVKRMPNLAEAYYRLAMLWGEKKEMDEAMRCVETALRLSPDEALYLGLHVSLLIDLKRFDDAIADLDHLIETNHTPKAFLLAKAELLMTLERYDEADATYRRLLKLKPKDEPMRQLMRAYFESIGDEEALKKLKS